MKEWRKTLMPFIQKARRELAKIDPKELATKSGMEYHSGPKGDELRAKLFNKDYIISYPEFVIHEASGKKCKEEIQALLLHYLSLADGTPLTGKWVSFRELPKGGFYYQAFQGYSGDMLTRAFGNDLKRFSQAARRAGGVPLSLGDASFAFQALPRVKLAVVYWQGDEEFPAQASVLFDSCASHYLPVDGLAALGRWLASIIVKEE